VTLDGLRWLLARPIERVDTFTHTRLSYLPPPAHQFICALYDWSLGLTWREARS
jgi:hypothetical protein